MMYNLTLKFGDRYFTRTMNTTWDEAKILYGSKLVKITKKGGNREDQHNEEGW